MSRPIRLAGVSYAPPLHDHAKLGVKLDGIRQTLAKVMKDKPDFVCFPEICACSGGFDKALPTAPELDSFAAAVGVLAKEFRVNLVVPFIEKFQGRFYNSVPIVDRQGKLSLIYRKNFLTTGELEAGISPGWEVPVAECDGVRVGAAVCFDLNFPEVAEQLQKQRARLVFWPSMYWGGRLLQHWALRYGFYMVVAYGAESAIVDMSGRHLIKQGPQTVQVRSGRLPPWAVAEVNAERDLFHLDFNMNQIAAIREKYGPAVEMEMFDPEAYFLLSSRQPGLTVDSIAAEFKLERLYDYLARSVKMRDDHLRGHPEANQQPPRTGPLKRM